jgi:transcriptional regulator with XRE-family HTH domain
MVVVMVTATQIRAARAMLNLTQAQLARLAGVSLPRILHIEAGANSLQSTHSAIVAALEAQGAVFSRDGSVNVLAKAERAIWDGPPADAATRRVALQIINAGRKRDGLPPLVDPDE